MSVSFDDALTRTVLIPVGVDLHARPAGALVRAAAAHSARITLRSNGREADAKSILQVLALGATGGTPIVVEVCGPEASAALDAVGDLLETLD